LPLELKESSKNFYFSFVLLVDLNCNLFLNKKNPFVLTIWKMFLMFKVRMSLGTVVTLYSLIVYLTLFFEILVATFGQQVVEPVGQIEHSKQQWEDEPKKHTKNTLLFRNRIIIMQLQQD
jgi:hypothetical protein